MKCKKGERRYTPSVSGVRLFTLRVHETLSWTWKRVIHVCSFRFFSGGSNCLEWRHQRSSALSLSFKHGCRHWPLSWFYYPGADNRELNCELLRLLIHLHRVHRLKPNTNHAQPCMYAVSIEAMLQLFFLKYILFHNFMSFNFFLLVS